MQWQCPKCAWVSGSGDESCKKCGASVRPSVDEPARPPDPLDLIGRGEARTAGPVELAAEAIHRLTRVTRERAMALFGESLRMELTKRGDKGHRAWQAIAEMPESDQRAALECLVDDLEKGVVALYSIRDGERGSHPLTVEDARTFSQRPKVEEYGNYLFVVCFRRKSWMQASGCPPARPSTRPR